MHNFWLLIRVVLYQWNKTVMTMRSNRLPILQGILNSVNLIYSQAGF
jgi:hypothetical protein